MPAYLLCQLGTLRFGPRVMNRLDEARRTVSMLSLFAGWLQFRPTVTLCQITPPPTVFFPHDFCCSARWWKRKIWNSWTSYILGLNVAAWTNAPMLSRSCASAAARDRTGKTAGFTAIFSQEDVEVGGGFNFLHFFKFSSLTGEMIKWK